MEKIILKTTTRIFAAGAMAALLIGLNTGAFACEMCAEPATKTTARTTKPVAKTLASAKLAPKTAKKSALPTKAAKAVGVKTASVKTASVKTAMLMCPKCQPDKASAKK